MNFTDLRYMVEIEKYSSISLAAKKLYVAQSNLSRSVKKLEDKFNIIIFERTSKGVTPTREGLRFLNHAKEILYQVDSLNDSYTDLRENKVDLRMSMPRAAYISEVFANFVKSFEPEDRLRIHYYETNSMKTIANVLDHNYDIGVIRYNALHEGYFLSLLKLKKLGYKFVFEFDYLLTVSKDSTLADRHIRSDDDLKDHIEVVYGDKRLPSGEFVDLNDNEQEEMFKNKVIYIYERGVQLEFLEATPEAYMWISPIPQQVLDKHGLIQMRCGAYAKHMKDVLIYKEDKPLKAEAKIFLDMLREKTREYGCYFY